LLILPAARPIEQSWQSVAANANFPTLDSRFLTFATGPFMANEAIVSALQQAVESFFGRDVKSCPENGHAFVVGTLRVP
jgi:hypothetical protein